MGPEQQGNEPMEQSGFSVDARGAIGVQVGEGGTQIIYTYDRRTWTDAPASPLVDFTGTVESPYRGLGAFEERDAAFFFGREQATNEVLNRTARCMSGPGLLVVSGVSGAGKSSLLRAGVIPQIRGAGLASAPESHTWPCLVFTPGAAPLERLAVRAASLAGIDAASVRRELRDDPTAFALIATQAAFADGSTGGSGPLEPGTDRRLLLVVDQFEQVFTQCEDEAQRRGFINALYAAATTGDGQTPAALVILIMRSDFEARSADYPQLADAVQDRFLLTSMTPRQLRMAITEPARKAGASVSGDLVELLLGEVRTRTNVMPSADPGSGSVVGAGMLPLLSHALDQTWRIRSNRSMLTIADYERIGGIERAVADSAQRAYMRLDPAQQAAAKQVFLRLIATGSDGVESAIQTGHAELTESKNEVQARDVQAVLGSFATERLLTLAADSVQISHEVLLTAWPLLRDTWLADTHADRIVLTRLRIAAREWADHNRDSSYLYTGSLLEHATSAASRSQGKHQLPVGERESSFLHVSGRADRRRVRRRRRVVASMEVV